VERVDEIIHARWVLPVDPPDRVLDRHAVVLRGGRILAVLPGALADSRYEAAITRNLDHHVLMPGLVNAHGHGAMTLLRGLADDHTLMDWLNNSIWPAERRWVGEDFVRAGTRLAIAEMLASGTTCYSDMYFFPDVIAETVVESGFRAQIAFPILDHPSRWAADADEYLAKGLKTRDLYRSCPRLSFAFGPHAPYTTRDETLSRVAMLAAELDAPVQMHVHETADEVANALTQSGERPLARLDRLGLLAPRFQAVHMTQLNATDLEMLARNQVQVVHCPSSNLKLAAGFCPVRSLGAAGVNVAFGTDGAASNNTLDMFAEMRLAALLAKGSSGDPTALGAHAAIRMATLGGAQALGLADRIGSLQPGKDGDLIAVNMRRSGCQPVYDLHSALVYTGSGAAVTHAWIEGRAQLLDGEPCHFDTDELLQTAQRWRDLITAHGQDQESIA
jgi:5-methylthioadenosine/S-adenosylhomocysteine deaminase